MSSVACPAVTQTGSVTPQSGVCESEMAAKTVAQAVTIKTIVASDRRTPKAAIANEPGRSDTEPVRPARW